MALTEEFPERRKIIKPIAASCDPPVIQRHMEKTKVVVILGPTAAGKSALAIELAMLFGAEIISADSMQVYKHMDIGTAKPGKAERDAVPHHLIDIAEPSEEYNAERFRVDASRKADEIRERGKNVFIAGGTGLYIKALISGLFAGPEADPFLREELMTEARAEGKQYLHERLRALDPAAAALIHPNNLTRVIRALEVSILTKRAISEHHSEHAFSEERFIALKIGLTKERERLYADIGERVDSMIARGLLEETKRLLAMGYSSNLKPMRGLGYKEMTGFLDGRFPFDEAVALIKQNTRHYAKRQMTWFKKDPGIRWFYPGEKNGIITLIKEFLD